RGASLARDLSADFGVLFLAAGERDAKAIPQRELRRFYRFRRDLFELSLGHEPGNFCGDLHDFLQEYSTYRPDRDWSSKFLLFLIGFLVARLGNDFGNCAARRAEFDRYDSRIADDFAAQFADLRHRLVKILNLNGKVMNARP